MLRLDTIGKKREEEMWGWNVDFLVRVAAFIETIVLFYCFCPFHLKKILFLKSGID